MVVDFEQNTIEHDELGIFAEKYITFWRRSSTRGFYSPTEVHPPCFARVPHDMVKKVFDPIMELFGRHVRTYITATIDEHKWITVHLYPQQQVKSGAKKKLPLVWPQSGFLSDQVYDAIGQRALFANEFLASTLAGDMHRWIPFA